MHKIIYRYLIVVTFFFFILFIAAGCSSKDEKTAGVAKPVIAPGPAIDAAPQDSVSPAASAASSQAPSAPAAMNVGTSAVAVEVDGAKLTVKQLDSEIQQKLTVLKGQIPPESFEKAKMEIRQSLVDEFVVETLLKNEIARKKIAATEKEITEILDAMKSQLPAGVTMDDFLKKSNTNAVDMRKKIILNIGIGKLVLQEMGGKVTVADKDIADFYKKNMDKFKKPESVHARHILIASAPGDAGKIKADKKAKAEALRKQLLAGAGFADLAKKNSDCPSKESGGDLGSFSRGQMVKSFEDAAFSQEKKAIGPVVETEFGFHIIQVLEHQIAQVLKLDAEMKKQIGAFLEQQLQQNAFDGMVKKLKAGANIVVYGK